MALPVYQVEAITEYLGGNPPNDYTAGTTYTYDLITGAFPRIDRRAVPLFRPGVKNHALVLAEERGRVFTLDVKVYMTDLDNWSTILANLQAFIGLPYGVAITKNDNLGWPFDLLDVQPTSEPRRLSSVGGAIVGPTANSVLDMQMQLIGRNPLTDA